MYHCSELPATFNSYCHQMKKPRRPCTTAQRCLRPSIDQISKPMRKPRKPNEPMNAYTSPHAPTDTVARIGPDSVKLARNGCMLPSAARLILSRYCTHHLDNRVLVPCAHALRQPRGFHLSWNEALYCFARRRPQLTRGPTACGHRRFELLASCVYAARPLRSWFPATAHVTVQYRMDTFCAQCQCLPHQLCIRGGER